MNRVIRIKIKRKALYVKGLLFESHNGSRFGRVPQSKPGFTLIEILVAISILAIAMTVILQLFSGGLKSARISNVYTQAIFHAREKMDESLLDSLYSDGMEEGVFDDGYQWKSEVTRVELDEEEQEKLPYYLYNINIKIIWDMGRSEKVFEVSTLRIVEKDESDEVQE